MAAEPGGVPGFGLTGKTALVTGSSRGIGRAIADGLRACGARVVYHGHEERPADLPGSPLVHYVQADLTDPNAPARLIAAASDSDAGPEIVVSNAGGFFDVPFLEMTPERWERTMALNLRAGYFLLQAWAKRRVAVGSGGAAVIVASTNGFQAEHDSTAYDVSKGALVMLVRTLAVSLAAHHIRVNGIAPGLIRTPLTQGWIDTDAAARMHYERTIPLGHIGQSDDCVGAALFLASPLSAYVTGQILAVDGGLTALQISPPGP